MKIHHHMVEFHGYSPDDGKPTMSPQHADRAGIVRCAAQRKGAAGTGPAALDAEARMGLRAPGGSLVFRAA